MSRQPGRPPSRPGLKNVATLVMNTIDRLINQLFAFNHPAALLRSMVIGVVFILIWLLFAFTAFPAAEYPKLVQNWVNGLANNDSQNTLITGVKIIYTIFFNMTVIRHLLAFYLPFWLMQRVAAIYLADIFEKEESVAHTFIRQAAFGESYNTIHIRHGKVAEEYQKSPMIQIGGPGIVIVELDSAVVFEKPDGSARVIGPQTKEIRTGKEKPGSNSNSQYGSVLIEGFERIRQCVDLRDVIQNQEISTRSRDGIPVSAKDIQYSYSIYRGPTPVKSNQTPYPYDEDAVLNLVYGGIRPVKLGEPPKQIQDWLDPLPSKIVGQISSEMSNFINKRGLSDFLATTGKPEDASLEERRKDTDERMRTISGPTEARPDRLVNPNSDAANEQDAQPDTSGESLLSNQALEFVPRSVLTKMITENFQKKAQQRGTQLNWIGVGTWNTPTSIIPKNHHDAWKISRENFARGNPTELQRIVENARQLETLRLIEEVPIRTLFIDLENLEVDKQVLGVLKAYLGHFERARELYRRESIPEELLKAIREIQRWLYPNGYYSVGDEE